MLGVNMVFWFLDIIFVFYLVRRGENEYIFFFEGGFWMYYKLIFLYFIGEYLRKSLWKKVEDLIWNKWEYKIRGTEVK